MNRLRTFQALVVVAWLLDAFVRFHWFLPDSFLRYLHWALADARVLDLISGSGYGAYPIAPESVLTALFTIGWTIAAIGLFFIQNWGRHLYLGLTVLSFVQSALSGMVVLDPGGAILFGLLGYMDGAILALAYLGPLSAEFNRKEPFNNVLQPNAPPDIGAPPS